MATGLSRRPAPTSPEVAATAIERARIWLPVPGAAGRRMEGLPPSVERALAVARECGAPLGPVLDAAAASATHRRRIEQDLHRVVGPAVAVARGLLVLPLVVVPVLAGVLDLDLAAFFLGEPIGRVVGAVVAALLGAAGAWMRLLVIRSRRRTGSGPGVSTVAAAAGVALLVVGWWAAVLVALVAWSRRAPVTPEPDERLDEATDLVATAMAAGHDAPAALRVAARHLPDAALADELARLALRLSLDPPVGGADTAAGRDPIVAPGAVAPLADVLAEVVAAGSPASGPLRELAARLREHRAARVRAEIARLPARLTFPTTLLLVPATVLAIGAPIVVRGLSALAGT